MASESVVHQVAAKGFGTGTNELYDRARPSYQPSVLSWIRKAVRKTDGEKLNVLEIGAGTGIFTRALLAHPDWKDDVGELMAVEPSEGMREQFTKTTTSTQTTISVHPGHFASTPAPAAWADLLVIAQAFHWCPDHASAVKEFARVLKPGAPVVLVWNLEDRDTAPWVAQLRDRIERHEGGTPQFRLGLWRAFADTKEWRELFRAEPVVGGEPLPSTDLTTLPHTAMHTVGFALQGTEQLTLDRACSKSFIALLSEEERQEVSADWTSFAPGYCCVVGRGHCARWDRDIMRGGTGILCAVGTGYYERWDRDAMRGGNWRWL